MRNTVSKGRKIKSAVLNTIMYTAVGIIVLLLTGLIGCILYRGIPNISWKFISESPSFINGTVGIFPNILNTFYIILMTLIVVIPVGTGAAIYLNEYARSTKAVRLTEFAAETLAGIPSIIYGLVGMLVFVQFFSLGTSLAAGSLTLAVMTLPTIMRTVQESLKTVPMSYREGAFALGSGKWHMIRTVIMPSAVDGIVTGCILAVGRIAGESAALLFTAGMTDEILSLADAFSKGQSGSTLTVALYIYAKERGDTGTAFAIAVILLIFTLIINISAKYAAAYLKRGK